MNIDGEMLPIPPVDIKPGPLRAAVYMTNEDMDIINSKVKRTWKAWASYTMSRKADDLVMLTRTMCPEAKPAVKDLAVFLKFSQ
jgi:hypothetical protein